MLLLWSIFYVQQLHYMTFTERMREEVYSDIYSKLFANTVSQQPSVAVFASDEENLNHRLHLLGSVSSRP